MALHPVSSKKSASSDYYCQQFIILLSSCLHQLWLASSHSKPDTHSEFAEMLFEFWYSGTLLFIFASFAFLQFSNFRWSDYRNVLLCTTTGLQTP